MSIWKFWFNSLHRVRDVWSRWGSATGGFIAFVVATLLVPLLPDWEGVKWIQSHQAVLIIGAVILISLFHGPYAVYAELETKAKEERDTFLKQIQELQRAKMDRLDGIAAANIRAAEDVGKEYARLWRERDRPGHTDAGARLECLLDAGLLSVEHVPDCLKIAQKSARLAGADDPYVGFDQKHLFALLTWAVTRTKGRPNFRDDYALREAFFGDFLTHVWRTQDADGYFDPWVDETTPVEVTFSSADPKTVAKT